MNVLIIGRGSIGTKHLHTLQALQKKYGLTLHTFAPTSHTSVKYYAQLRKELIAKKIQAAFVCNPTSMHTETTLMCLNAGAHVFLEKPIAATLDAKAFTHIQKLLGEKRLTLMVGYDMRFNPYIEKVKKLIDKKTIGDIWGARVYAGQYLPDWRPSSDYRKSYSAKKALGGGVLLDLSHELDYLHWLLPKKIKNVSACNLHTGRLAIETEDISSVTIEYTDKSTAHVHLDYLNVPYRRSLELYGDKGTILWDDNTHTIRLYTKRAGKWQTFTVTANEASGSVVFTKELSHFFDCIKYRRTPLNSFENSVYIMKLIDTIKRVRV